MFVSTCVVGLIITEGTFSVMRRPLIRDLLFFIVAVLLSAAVLITGQLYAWQAISEFTDFVKF